MNNAQIEALALKLWALEHEAIHNKEKNSMLYSQIEMIWWVASLMGVSDKVSAIRQKQTEMNNKTFNAGAKSVMEDK